MQDGHLGYTDTLIAPEHFADTHLYSRVDRGTATVKLPVHEISCHICCKFENAVFKKCLKK